MINKKAVIGRTMTLVSTILFVILIMALFGFYSAALGATKEGSSGPDSLYEVDKNSIFFSSMNLSDQSEVILYAMIKEYVPKNSDFSDEFKRGIYRFMHSDSYFTGKESCLLLTIGDYSNMHKQIIVDPSNDNYNLYLIKGSDEKILNRYESEHKENIREIDENVYFGKSESKVIIDEKEVSVFSYYGECT